MTDQPNHFINPMTQFPNTYRMEEIQSILQWVANGEHGVVIGPNGTGKSNIASYLACRPEVTASLLPRPIDEYCFLSIDLNSLPVITTAALYRSLLYTIEDAVENRPALASWSVQTKAIVATVSSVDDTVGLYFTLQRVHQLLIKRSGKQIIWLLQRFDECCRRLDTAALNSLRSLRDQFKGQISYIVFVRFPLSRLRNPTEYDEFHDIMIMNQCWVGPMNQRDGFWIARQIMQQYGVVFPEAAIATLFDLCGGLPAFLKVAYTALATGTLDLKDSVGSWRRKLLAHPAIQSVCREIWKDCSFEERSLLLLLALAGEQAQADESAANYLKLARVLITEEPTNNFKLFSLLFTDFVRQQQAATERGIVLRQGVVFRDGLPLSQKLAPLEQRLVEFFCQHIGEVCRTVDLVNHLWPDEHKDDLQEYHNRLSQRVTSLRRKIEAGQPWSYIQAVHGRGYQFNQPPTTSNE